MSLDRSLPGAAASRAESAVEAHQSDAATNASVIESNTAGRLETLPQANGGLTSIVQTPDGAQSRKIVSNDGNVTFDNGWDRVTKLPSQEGETTFVNQFGTAITKNPDGEIRIQSDFFNNPGGGYGGKPGEQGYAHYDGMFNESATGFAGAEQRFDGLAKSIQDAPDRVVGNAGDASSALDEIRAASWGPKLSERVLGRAPKLETGSEITGSARLTNMTEDSFIKISRAAQSLTPERLAELGVLDARGAQATADLRHAFDSRVPRTLDEIQNPLRSAFMTSKEADAAHFGNGYDVTYGKALTNYQSWVRDLAKTSGVSSDVTDALEDVIRIH